MKLQVLHIHAGSSVLGPLVSFCMIREENEH